jgi:hypothetical protein
MGSHLNGVDPRILKVSKFVSTPRLDEPRLDEPDLDVPGPNEPRLDEPEPDPQHPDEPGSDSQDIGSAAIDVHDVLSATIARFDSAASDLKDTEEGASMTSASAQAPTRYRCGVKRLDGSLCHATFAHRTAVSRHQKTSAHMRLVLCPFCPGPLRQPPRLLLHVQKYHPEKLWTHFRCWVCGSEKLISLKNLGLHVHRYHKNLSLEKRYNATRGF